ncbi:MAG TPA: PDZ domain-containing protein [Gemmatimonadaceae bacterium]|nr:PDZ domain-containing protein [Gemmatimonadaceae bacterium]
MRGYKTLFAAVVLALSTAPCSMHAQFRRFPSDPGSPKRASSNTPSDNDAPDARTLLGLTLGSSGTDRDTLGLLVTQVMRDGPADRAGIDEGNRLADIDGVSLRLDPSDIGRTGASDAVMRRLTRTLRGLHDGEQATIRVFSGGRFKAVTVQVGNATPNGGITAATPVPMPPSAPTAVAVAIDAPTRPTTVANALQTLSDLQAQLRRMSDDEGMTPLGDSLAQSARDLAAIQRRLRSAQEIRRRNDDFGDRSAVRRGSNSEVPGLSLSPVSDDLADYFGDGSERGLLVLQADASWSPVRTGDVLLSIDGAPVTADRLRAAMEAHQSARIELLRRRRQTTVTLGGRE